MAQGNRAPMTRSNCTLTRAPGAIRRSTSAFSACRRGSCNMEASVQPAKSVIEVRNLAKVFGSAAKVEALRAIDLTISAGEFVAVMGRSGSGKSTLLHLICGLDEPTAGSIEIAGAELARLSEDERARLRRDRLGLVFQAFHLLGTLTAEENVLLPLAI